jgi:tetratricopeptide (TPR) repeat protein
MMRTLISCLAAALLLGGCASEAPALRIEKPAVATLEAQLADADRSLAAGQPDKAYAALKTAAGHYPAEKAPWLQMAQLKFERNSYADAIASALEALQRDPLDRQANSIVAVSGLRLATRSLADLSQQNNLGGSVRSEAQELAALLRTSLGEEVLVPPRPKAAAAPRKPAPAGGAARKPSGQSTPADPFGALK